MNEKIREIISANNILILDTRLEELLEADTKDESIIDYIWMSEVRSIIKDASQYVCNREYKDILFVLTDKKLGVYNFLVSKPEEGHTNLFPFWGRDSIPLDCIKRSYSNYHYDYNSLAFELSIDKENTSSPLYIECELTNIKCHDFIKNLVQALIEKNTGKG